MSTHGPADQEAFEPTAEAVAHLLDVVADHNVGDALTNMADTLERLRASAAEAAEARAVLRDLPAPLLREAMRLRAARVEAQA